LQNLILKSKSTQIFNSINQQLELSIIIYEIEITIEESNNITICLYLSQKRKTSANEKHST